MADVPTLALTVAVTTRNRPQALLRCLTSLSLLGDLVGEVLIADDASDEPLEEVLARLPEDLRRKVEVLRMPERPGLIVGRNRMIQRAANDLVLLLDDDAFVLESSGIGKSLALLATDPTLAAVAYAQAEANGEPWPSSMQPAPVGYRCYVPSFIGYAHLLRRSTFLALGGYDETFVIQGEEKEWCLRALDAGLRVVYLPDVRVAHVPDPSGRDSVRYLRYVIRNECLAALRREPLPLPFLTVPLRLRRYFTMRRHLQVSDPAGFRWLVREIVAALPSAGSGGRVRWATLRRWRRMRRERPPYPPQAVA